MKKIKVGIAICTYNRIESVQLLLADIKNQTLQPDQLIFIEDTNSGQYFSEAKLNKFLSDNDLNIIYKSCKYKNIAKSRNLVLKFQNVDLLICIDDDVRIPSDYFEKILTLYKKYPLSLGFFGKVLPTSNDSISVVSSYYFNQELSNEKKETKTVFAPFVAIGLNTKILKKYNFQFNADYPMGEDTEFCKKHSNKGHYFIFSPRVFIFHSFSVMEEYNIVKFFKRFFVYGLLATKLHFTKGIYCFEVDYYVPKNVFHIIIFPFFLLKRLLLSNKYFHERSGLQVSYFRWSLLLHTFLLLGIYSSKEMYNSLIFKKEIL